MLARFIFDQMVRLRCGHFTPGLLDLTHTLIYPHSNLGLLLDPWLVYLWALLSHPLQHHPWVSSSLGLASCFFVANCLGSQLSPLAPSPRGSLQQVHVFGHKEAQPRNSLKTLQFLNASTSTFLCSLRLSFQFILKASTHAGSGLTILPFLTP